MGTTSTNSPTGLFGIFNNLTIAKKIGIGTGLILVFLVAVSLIAYLGLTGADRNFKQYRSYAIQTNQLGRIQANLLLARLYAKDYILKNTDEAAEKVSGRIVATSNLIEEAQDMFTRPEALELMATAKRDIALYQSSFDRVTELVKQRNEIVDTLNTLGPSAERNLTEIMQSAFADNDATASFYAGKDLRSLLLARLYANRFLIDNEPASAERANSELADFKSLAGRMLSELQNPKRRELASSVLKEAGEYEAAFNNVVEIINERNGIIRGTLDVIGPRLAEQTEQLKLANKGLQDTLGPQATQEVSDAVLETEIVSLVAILVGILLIYAISRAISRPVINMSSAMRNIASGKLDETIPALGQKDEIGLIAEALSSFKDAAIEKQEIERSAEEERQATEKERSDREAQKAVENEQVQFAVSSMAQGLSKFADGDLAFRLEDPFEGSLDGLRNDFNNSISKINETLSQISSDAHSIDSKSASIRDAADNLSGRTERQAASLEESSAALEEITKTVEHSTQQASDAAKAADSAKSDAEQSREVVVNAMSAMERIEKASNEISTIINVIDEIAFQTNLLALNAGVEAARAGEVGKGFAVVAQEVRDLAQRATTAADEIKELITKSGQEVTNGGEMVRAAGQSLSQISEHVTNISEQIKSIAVSATEQLSGIREVSQAVAQMDQTTQENAAMVEESNAVTAEMAEEIRSLTGKINTFKLERDRGLAHMQEPQLAAAG
ncbi:HAMP domain-containing methyl-accepting chemotaxis protein [Hoeflea poritis]|uniref:HAMP domain-containing methyl-accepting chemotaxis protein n=1 Tax=Hoeflea poritis TaxID=2993659 RepID=A0ABT4VIT6_9HYPH|nr:HAMP domain-containing methyl-accepting chemotaxis protein [Hoeflea poritis]MDA4844624.1 HAMP domain-containing methyl-accepting chemotaxis protein [Hoeflea poritis]